MNHGSISEVRLQISLCIVSIEAQFITLVDQIIKIDRFTIRLDFISEKFFQSQLLSIYVLRNLFENFLFWDSQDCRLLAELVRVKRKSAHLALGRHQCPHLRVTQIFLSLVCSHIIEEVSIAERGRFLDFSAPFLN